MKKGFTLIEILIVISIIGIIAVFILPQMGSYALKKSQDTSLKDDLKQYQTALESYSNDNSSLYPLANSAIDVSNLCSSGQSLNSYMQTCPQSKDALHPYYYESTANKTSYVLWAKEPSGTYWVICSNKKTKEVSSVSISQGNCPL